MNKGRLEAFSDGVLAIIITIMVLELKVPHSPELSSLVPMLPTLFCYLISFIYVGIYWSNHHHLMHSVRKVNGAILWANLHLLFWLSLVPFTTAWMGENHFPLWPVVFYGFNLMMSGVAYYILTRTLLSIEGPDSTLARALKCDYKGKISVVLYAIAIAAAFYESWISYLIYVGVAGMWLVPDRRIENILVHTEG